MSECASTRWKYMEFITRHGRQETNFYWVPFYRTLYTRSYFNLHNISIRRFYFPHFPVGKSEIKQLAPSCTHSVGVRARSHSKCPCLFHHEERHTCDTERVWLPCQAMSVSRTKRTEVCSFNKYLLLGVGLSTKYRVIKNIGAVLELMELLVWWRNDMKWIKIYMKF